MIPSRLRIVAATCLALAATACDRDRPLAGPAAAADAASPETLPVSLPQAIGFNAHIRPILSDKCFSCHGFDATTREADLRLDTPEGAYAALSGSSDVHAIVPGDAAASEVWKRITTSDPEDLMPPPDFHKPLDVREIQLIKAWIDQGAPYEEHWAFTTLTRPDVPVPAVHAAAVANPIDAFILARLEEEGLSPAPPAGKEALLRRLSLDLTGLPPDDAELAAFLVDDSPDAYEKQVERLLASPHFGERMAVPWLDVVRFADTVGYHGDQNLRVFPYRDYVIKSFNDNKPFDQFTIEQLAGDLLPEAGDEQLVATGFLRLNLMTREGGAQEKEYLAKSMADRVRAVGAAWLGLTTGCAECHDHKFDPVTTRDFYALGAFFADVRQWGVYADYHYTPNPDLRGVNNDWPFPPEIQVRNAAVQERLARLQDEAVALLAAGRPAALDDPAVQAWKPSAADFARRHPDGWQPLAPGGVTSSQGTPHEILGDHSVRFTGDPRKDDAITIELPLPAENIRAIRFEALPGGDDGGRVGRRPDGRFAVTPEFAIVDAAGDSAPLAIAWRQADRRTPHGYRNGDHAPLLEPEWRAAPALWEEPQDAASHPQHALYHLAETAAATPGRTLRVTLASENIGRVRFSITPFGDAVPGADAIRSELRTALSAAEPSPDDAAEIAAAHLLGTTPDEQLPGGYKSLRAAIIDCRAGFAHSVVAQTLPADQIPPTHLLPRGEWMNPGETIAPALPGFLPRESVRADGGRLTRLDLAKWLTADENPLTARHVSNRLWKQFFGKGLSNVLDDLGNQGEWPSHPQLLDWLAAEFRDSGWDTKHLVRLMVGSNTYRQRAATRPELAAIDPENRLLAEQSARRLEAEFIRDNALAISGLLERHHVGGPSVKPYQPAGYYANLNFPIRDYHATTGGDQYRRGLYMHWQRTFTHPMLAGFDAPSREECSADRFLSNSPQQALTLLNDPSFVEAARAFADRLAREKPSAGDEEKIRHAYRLALARDPRGDELASLAAFVERQRANYAAKPDEARALLKTGHSPPAAGDTPAELAESAAWTQACRVLLNLHETITRF
jgi:hypothetical protein